MNNYTPLSLQKFTSLSLWFFFDLPVYRQFISSHSREAKILLYVMSVIYNWNYKLQKL